MSASPTPTHRPRSRSFSSTPTFSSDLSKLRNASNDGIVTSYSQAVRIASTFDVLTSNHSPLASKVELKCEDDWISLLNRSGCVQRQRGAAQDVVNVNDVNTDHGAEELLTIDLERFLRYCFDVAYKMPASPNTACRPKPNVAGVHERSKSHGNIPVAPAPSSAKRGIVLP